MDRTRDTSTGLPSFRENLVYSTWKTSLGMVYAAATSQGLCYLTLGVKSVESSNGLLQRVFQVKPGKNDGFFLGLQQELDRYLEGNPSPFSMPVDLRLGTPFQAMVWSVLKGIPYGLTFSYRWVATQIGNPKAFRAVGNACGQNPIPIIIPCHRVVSASGRIGGYSGGPGLKVRLLTLENALMRAPAPHTSPALLDPNTIAIGSDLTLATDG